MIKYPTKEITKVLRDAGLPVGKAYRQKGNGGTLKLYRQESPTKARRLLRKAFPAAIVEIRNERDGWFRRGMNVCRHCGHHLPYKSLKQVKIADLYIWWE